MGSREGAARVLVGLGGAEGAAGGDWVGGCQWGLLKLGRGFVQISFEAGGVEDIAERCKWRVRGWSMGSEDGKRVSILTGVRLRMYWDFLVSSNPCQLWRR